MADSYKAKAMKPVDIHGLRKSPDVAGGVMVDGSTKPPHKPGKGENPRSAMIDGPYGGKRPQS